MNQETAPKKNEHMKHVEWWFLFAILIMIVVTVFALSNASPAPVRFFVWTFELSLALLIFISAAIGAVIAIILGLVKQLSNRKRFKQLEKQVSSLEKEKAELQRQVAEMEAQQTKTPETPPDSPSGQFSEEHKTPLAHSTEVD